MTDRNDKPLHFVVRDETADAAVQREDDRDARIARVVEGAIRAAISEHGLTAEERQWVRLAVQREARREALHRAVIEKSAAGLVWAVIAGFGWVVWHLIVDYAKNHGWKP